MMSEEDALLALVQGVDGRDWATRRTGWTANSLESGKSLTVNRGVTVERLSLPIALFCPSQTWPSLILHMSVVSPSSFWHQ